MQLGTTDPRSRVSTRSTDRAVSPVIGVILMVAITVILAAVIGVFVLGLGDELGQAQPSNSISVDGEIADASGTGSGIEVTISHDSGDSVDAEDVDVVLRYDGASQERVGFDVADIYGDGEFSVGDSAEIDQADESTGDPFDVTLPDSTADDEPVEIELVHTPSDSIIASGELDVVDEDLGN